MVIRAPETGPLGNFHPHYIPYIPSIPVNLVLLVAISTPASAQAQPGCDPIF